MISDLSSVVEAQIQEFRVYGETSSLAFCKRKLCIHSLAVLSKENAFKNISGLWSPRQSRYVVHCSSTGLPYHIGFSESFVPHTYLGHSLSKSNLKTPSDGEAGIFPLRNQSYIT